MQQRHLIFIASLFTVISTTQINYFEVTTSMPFPPDPVTIYDTLIMLSALVTDCPPPSCECFVKVNVTTYKDTYTVTFPSTTPNIGSATITDLEADTLYSFTITCIGADGNATRLLRTDYGRPSVPRNITVTLVSKRLRISWLPPAVPKGPIHNYKLTKDRETISDEIPNNESSCFKFDIYETFKEYPGYRLQCRMDQLIINYKFIENRERLIEHIPNNQFSYDVTRDYVYGETDLFQLSACNINRRHRSICSQIGSAMMRFFRPPLTASSQQTISSQRTSSLQTATPKNASGILSSSKLLATLMIFVVLFR
ncbi:unnamed protein product [Rotaria magnacalcarata]|uniref:Fibronectin type-III domain-containing protein n=1 Tax=Rotaria magnacalcarata TaxID=392030 RepID=A0A816YZX0_9BILA|nr:unnamed protein product [Rotaria magnacalcarata]